MSEPLKLLFDECISGPLVTHLAALLAYTREEQEVRSILEHVPPGTHDEVWVPQIAGEGWILVTGDSGRGGRSKGEKLPIVCARYSVTHVMFSGRLQQRNGFEKVRAIMSVWEDICELPTHPKGSAWQLRLLSPRTVALQPRT